MFCRQCQEAAGNKACVQGGCCGKDAETSNLMDELIVLLQAVALTLEAKPQVTREFSRFLCRALTATLTNTNFDPNRIYRLMDEAKRALRTLDSTVEIPPVGENVCKNEDAQSLRELLLCGLKGVSAYAFHAFALGKEDNAVYNFAIHALAALADPDFEQERLLELVGRCGEIALIAMAMLDEAHTSNFGDPERTEISCSVGTRPGILISGHDLKDLSELLAQSQDEGIDVYTHGEMLSAHCYPAFRRYTHLRGSYGASWRTQDRDFAAFNGVIIMTGNCLVPVRDSYRNRIFTTGMAGWPGVPHIPHRHIGACKNFGPAIDLAKTLPPPTKLESGHIVAGFAHEQILALSDRIVDAVKSGAIRRFIVMAGCDGRHKSRDYYTRTASLLPKDAVILTAGCAKYRCNKLNLGDIGGIPRVLDAGQCNDSYSLVRAALALQKAFGLNDVKELPISFDLAWYEQKAVAVLLALLFLGFRDIRLGPTLPAFLSSGAIDFLVREYGIKPIGTPEDDVAAMMDGR